MKISCFTSNRVGEEDGDHVYAPTAYTADDGANRSSRVNLQTGTTLHLPIIGGAVTETPDMSVESGMRILGALRPTESRALSQDPDGKGRSNRSPSVWMQYVDPPPGTLRQTSYRTPPGLASHHRRQRAP